MIITKTTKFPHICEVCGRYEEITSEEAFNSGWDYPPDFGSFGVLSPRTCPDCDMKDTTWWKFIRSRNKLINKFKTYNEAAEYIQSAIDDPSVDDVGFTERDLRTINQIAEEVIKYC